MNKITNSGEKVSWSAWEYEFKEQSNDWFWALGVIVVAGSIASVIFANYFFAMLLIIGGVLLGYFAKQKPGIAHYELNDKGLQIKNRIYPYKEIKAFWVQEGNVDGVDLKPMLFIKSSRLFLHIISFPIEPYHGTKIRDKMLANNIPEEEMKAHPSEKIMDFLGF